MSGYDSGGHVTLVEVSGPFGRTGGPSDAGDHRPVAPPEGMSTDQLAQFQVDFTSWARQRLFTDGQRQYDRGSRQAFEDMDFPTLIAAAQEELADIVNYATMLAIHLQRLKESV